MDALVRTFIADLAKVRRSDAPGPKAMARRLQLGQEVASAIVGRPVCMLFACELRVSF